MGADRRPVSTERDSPVSGPGEQASEMHLLAPERRLRVIAILEERPATTDRQILAHALATEESDANAPGDAAVRRVEIDLHHNHLPALDDAGVVQYDPDRGTVQLGDNSRVKRMFATVKR